MTLQYQHRTIDEYFPVKKVSELAWREKARGSPLFTMMFWWTRKPLVVSRAVVAGAIVSMRPEEFEKAIALEEEEKPPYEVNPKIRVEGIKLLDPFAGGGSIPFEALRMGIDVTAVELLPVAYVLLKATLEYPLKYGRRLVEDVKKWGEELIRRLEKRIGHLYPKSDLVYIGTWFVKCPKCGFKTPLVKDWRLSVKRKIWMKPVIKNGEFKVEIAGGEEKPPMETIRGGTGRCINCGNTISEYYIKDSIKRYLNGDPSLTEPRLLVKVVRTGGNIEFRPVSEDDVKLLHSTEPIVKDMLARNDPIIPTELLAEFGSTLPVRAHGFSKWYQLFNSRQLLTLTTIVKLIKEIEKEVEEEASREGLPPEYVKAVITYLALMLVEYARHNSLATLWNAQGEKMEHSLAFRRVSMTWNFCEVNPFVKTRGSLVNMLAKILSALRFAVDNLSASKEGNRLYQQGVKDVGKPNVKIILSSATSIPIDEKFDLIVTDPPYYDDVHYAELSDLYYVWLKRVLRDYYPEAFHYNTQWEELALQEVSTNPARFRTPNAKQRSIEHYRALLKASMKECYRLLKDDGLLVLFFAHSTAEAWRDLVEALQSSGFEITRTWPVHTEKTGRVTAKGKAVIDTSLIVVARKRKPGMRVGYIEELKPLIKDAVRSEVRKLVEEFNLKGADLINAAMGPALKIITQYDRIESINPGGVTSSLLELVTETVVPAFLEVKLGSQIAGRLDPYTAFYVYTRISYGVRGREKTLVLPPDHANRIGLALGISIDKLVEARIVRYTMGKTRRNIEVIIPKGDIKNFLRERNLDLDNPAPRSMIDLIHLLEAAYNLKGDRGVREIYNKLKGFKEFNIDTLKTVIQALHLGLDEDDPEKRLIKPLVNLNLRGLGDTTLFKYTR